MNNFIPAVEKETPANCKKFQESILNEALVYLLHHSVFGSASRLSRITPDMA
jgi:hypothetical protein